VKGAVDADRARTGYIGRETDAEHNLGAFGARLYSSEYGRFLAVDKLWEKYRSLQPYQYAGNSPVMAVDRNGKEIIAARDIDREYLKASMCSHFGIDVSFTDIGAMRISPEQLAQAQASNDPLSYGQLLNITEMANDNSKTLNVFALPGEEYRKDRMTLSSDMVPPPSSVFPTGPRASEVFISHADAPTNSAILIRPEIAGKETFAAVGGGETKPCGTCVLVHALLDHALPWFKMGFSATRKEGVQNHNVGLATKAQSVVRDGSDHDDEGKPQR
jgi:RHS repeat-associated protein